MKFKEPRQETEFASPQLFPLLREILLDAEHFSQYDGCDDLVITSIHRTDAEDLALDGSGIHCLWRAIDVRAKCWGDPSATRLASYINSKYQYDSSRPQLLVALFAEHGDGVHIHFQVHARTELKTKPK